MNCSKTTFTLFSNTPCDATEITCQNQQINKVNHCRLLGLTMDDNLTYREHIDQMCSKIHKNIYGLRILARNTSFYIAKTFYFSNIQSHLRYAILFWGSSSHAGRAFVAQKCAFRALHGLGFRDSCRGLFAGEGVLTVPAIYVYESISFLMKHPEYFLEYRSNTSFSERHGQCYRLPRHRLTKYEKGAIYACIRLWNKIPGNIKKLTTQRAMRRAVFQYLCVMEPYSVADFLEA